MKPLIKTYRIYIPGICQNISFKNKFFTHFRKKTPSNNLTHNITFYQNSKCYRQDMGLIQKLCPH